MLGYPYFGGFQNKSKNLYGSRRKTFFHCETPSRSLIVHLTCALTWKHISLYPQRPTRQKSLSFLFMSRYFHVLSFILHLCTLYFFPTLLFLVGFDFLTKSTGLTSSVNGHYFPSHWILVIRLSVWLRRLGGQQQPSTFSEK